MFDTHEIHKLVTIQEELIHDKLDTEAAVSSSSPSRRYGIYAGKESPYRCGGLEYLLLHRMPSTPPQVKLSFVLLPWIDRDNKEDHLPELLNTCVFPSFLWFLR